MGNEISSDEECQISSIKVSFDMSALEEGRLESIYIGNYQQLDHSSLESLGNDKINISEIVKRNSFVAATQEDAESLVLANETLDYVGDFPYTCDASEIETFDKLFYFVSKNNFELVSVYEEKTFRLFVIRPKA
jgi:hypothetical protein